MYEFHENRIRSEEASTDADLNFEEGVISDIFRKIVADIRSLISLNKEEKKKNKEDKEHSLGLKYPNFLEIIDNFFHNIFDSITNTQ